MTITTLDGLVNAMGNSASRLVIDKASIASQAAGTFVSLWRATGQPGQGAIPAAAAVCNNALTGAFGFTQQTAPATTYGGWLNAVSSNAAMTMEIHDRLMHMGGLNGTLTTAQTVNVDIAANLASNNLAERIGDSNYSDIQWWLEWYTATGATAVTATVGVTFNDGTTGTLSAALAATRPAGFMLPLNGLSTTAGKFIRDVDTVTLSATTGTAGSFGVTATRPRMSLPLNIANKMEVADWQMLGLPEIYNSSCLFPIVLTSTTSSGTLRGGGKLIHG
ncbi:hypothetical protein RCZAHN_40 [Rhodobacter phage RcZahn]|nr:hypothetical protein RCZAHN_40 [Rhodobacter phage RcZahn]